MGFETLSDSVGTGKIGGTGRMPVSPTCVPNVAIGQDRRHIAAAKFIVRFVGITRHPELDPGSRLWIAAFAGMTAKTPVTVSLSGFATSDGQMDIVFGNYYKLQNLLVSSRTKKYPRVPRNTGAFASGNVLPVLTAITE
jgi:hypothetical protein